MTQMIATSVSIVVLMISKGNVFMFFFVMTDLLEEPRLGILVCQLVGDDDEDEGEQ